MAKQKEYSIQGKITNQDGNPVKGAIVKAFDKDPKSKDDFLGESKKTDKSGLYTINYSEEDFRPGGNESGGADIVIEVYDTKGNLLGKSDMKKNCGQSENINLPITQTDKPGIKLNRLQRLEQELTPLLKKGYSLSSITKLNTTEFNNVLAKSQLPSKDKRDLTKAVKLAKKYEIDLQPALILASKDRKLSIDRTLDIAFENGELDKKYQKEVENIKLAYELVLDDKLLTKNLGFGTAKDILFDYTSKDTEQRTIIGAWRKSEGKSEKFKGFLEKEKFTQEYYEILFSLETNKIVKGDKELTRKIKEVFYSSQRNEIKHLLEIKVPDWEEFLEKNDVELPDTFSKSGDQNKNRNAFARHLAKSVEETYPNEALLLHINKNESFYPFSTETKTFIKKTPELDIRRRVKPELLKKGLKEKDKGIQGFVFFQNMYKITNSFGPIAKLKSENLTSAISIAQIGLPEFVESFESEFPGGKQDAEMAHKRAKHISTLSRLVLSDLTSNFDKTLPHVLYDTKNKEALSHEELDWRQFFGEDDLAFCDCASCKSVFGPAAYLFDMLLFLKRFSTKTTKEINGGIITLTSSLLRNLRNRRPDVPALELSCENTNIEVPYIDLVNEILGDLVEEHIKGSKELTSKNRSTTGTSELRKAIPEYPPAKEVLETLRKTYHPKELPFDYHFEKAKASRKLLQGNKYPYYFAEACWKWLASVVSDTHKKKDVTEKLGKYCLELSENEFNILANISSDIEKLWANEIADTSKNPSIKQLCDISGFDLFTLVGALESKFVSPKSTQLIPNNECNPNKLLIEFTDRDNSLLRLYFFLRIQKRLGWEAQEIDAMLSALTETVPEKKLQTVLTIIENSPKIALVDNDNNPINSGSGSKKTFRGLKINESEYKNALKSNSAEEKLNRIEELLSESLSKYKLNRISNILPADCKEKIAKSINSKGSILTFKEKEDILKQDLEKDTILKQKFDNEVQSLENSLPQQGYNEIIPAIENFSTEEDLVNIGLFIFLQERLQLDVLSALCLINTLPAGKWQKILEQKKWPGLFEKMFGPPPEELLLAAKKEVKTTFDIFVLISDRTGVPTDDIHLIFASGHIISKDLGRISDPQKISESENILKTWQEVVSIVYGISAFAGTLELNIPELIDLLELTGNKPFSRNITFQERQIQLVQLIETISLKQEAETWPIPVNEVLYILGKRTSSEHKTKPDPNSIGNMALQFLDVAKEFPLNYEITNGNLQESLINILTELIGLVGMGDSNINESTKNAVSQLVRLIEWSRVYHKPDSNEEELKIKELLPSNVILEDEIPLFDNTEDLETWNSYFGREVVKEIKDICQIELTKLVPGIVIDWKRSKAKNVYSEFRHKLKEHIRLGERFNLSEIANTIVKPFIEDILPGSAAKINAVGLTASVWSALVINAENKMSKSRIKSVSMWLPLFQKALVRTNRRNKVIEIISHAFNTEIDSTKILLGNILKHESQPLINSLVPRSCSTNWIESSVINATYRNGINHSTSNSFDFKATRNEASFDIDWSKTPPPSGIDPENFNVTLNANVAHSTLGLELDEAELMVESNGFVEITINGQSVLMKDQAIRTKTKSLPQSLLTSHKSTFFSVVSVTYQTPTPSPANYTETTVPNILRIFLRNSLSNTYEILTVGKGFSESMQLFDKSSRLVNALKLPFSTWHLLSVLPNGRAINLNSLTNIYGQWFQYWLRLVDISKLYKIVNPENQSLLHSLLMRGILNGNEIENALKLTPIEFESLISLINLDKVDDAKLEFKGEITEIQETYKVFNLCRQNRIPISVFADWLSISSNEKFHNTILSSLLSNDSDGDWLHYVTKFENPVREGLRNAFAAWLRNVSFSSNEAISEHLCTDIQMSSCYTTSRVQFAYGAVHKYIDRIRQGFEPGPEKEPPKVTKIIFEIALDDTPRQNRFDGDEIKIQFKFSYYNIEETTIVLKRKNDIFPFPPHKYIGFHELEQPIECSNIVRVRLLYIVYDALRDIQNEYLPAGGRLKLQFLGNEDTIIDETPILSVTFNLIGRKEIEINNGPYSQNTWANNQSITLISQINSDSTSTDNSEMDRFEREWEWRNSYRLWEANRRVFVHPENWLEPDLRPEKTPLFQEFEENLLKEPLTMVSAEKALAKYLNGLVEIARPEIIGVVDNRPEDNDFQGAIPKGFMDSELNGLHLFARSRNQPYQYFYRRRLPDVDGRWTPWEKIEAELPGTHYLPFIDHNRLSFMCAEFGNAARKENTCEVSSESSKNDPRKTGTVVLSWIERQHGEWSDVKRSETIEFDAGSVPYRQEPDARGTELKPEEDDFPSDRYPLDEVKTTTVTGISVDLSLFDVPRYDDKDGDEIEIQLQTKDDSNDDPLILKEKGNNKFLLNNKYQGELFDSAVNIVFDNICGFIVRYMTYDKQGDAQNEYLPIGGALILKFESDSEVIFKDVVVPIFGYRENENKGDDNHRIDSTYYYKNVWEFTCPINLTGQKGYQPIYDNYWMNFNAELVGWEPPPPEAYSLHINRSQDDEGATNIQLCVADNVKIHIKRQRSFKYIPPEEPNGITDNWPKEPVEGKTYCEQVTTVGAHLKTILLHSDNTIEEGESSSSLRLPFRSHENTLQYKQRFMNSIGGDFYCDRTRALTTGNLPYLVTMENVGMLDSMVPIRILDEISGTRAGHTLLLERIAPPLVTAEEPEYEPDEIINTDTPPWLVRSLWHPHASGFARILGSKSVSGLLTYNNQFGNRLPDWANPCKGEGFFEYCYDPDYNLISEPFPDFDIDFDLEGSYSEYNWELFLHAPLLIAQRLSEAGQFEEAETWFRLLINPYRGRLKLSPIESFMTKPLRDANKERLDKMLLMINEGEVAKELEKQIHRLNLNPFQPHLIARSRLSAYQKSLFMKYLDHLMAWGDDLFRSAFSSDNRRNLETAASRYDQVAKLLGDRPEVLPQNSTNQKLSFNELVIPPLDSTSMNAVNWDPLVAIETLLPSEPSLVPGITNDGEGIPQLYFCIPHNKKLMSYWDNLAERLTKLRSCQNIEGVTQSLSLYGKHIDPALLVYATAKGIDIDTIMGFISMPSPKYRFTALFQRAKEACQLVQSFEQALLSAIEKHESEELSAIRSKHELKLLQWSREVRSNQVNEAMEAIEVLNKSRKRALIRRKYYETRQRENMPEKAEGKALSHAVKEEERASGDSSTAADLRLVLPSLSGNVTAGYRGTSNGSSEGYYDISASAREDHGGDFFASIWEKKASSHRAEAAKYRAMSARLGRQAGHQRRWEEWQHQLEITNNDISHIDRQINSAEIRLRITEIEKENHEQQVDQVATVNEYIRSKFTNAKLYQWLETRLSKLHYQQYKMAYELTLKAQHALVNELGIEEPRLIIDTWDPPHRGLGASAELLHELEKLQIQYMEDWKTEHKKQKQFSLFERRPLCFLELLKTGTCIFQIFENELDEDEPGDYYRRIQQVSLDIPCVKGPRQSVNARLTLLRSEIRKKPWNTGEYYRAIGLDGSNDENFKDIPSSTEHIVTTTGVGDTGQLGSNSQPERLQPFEGSGVISTWRIDLDKKVNDFDIMTVSDVILTLNYNSRDAGELARSKALEERLKIEKEQGREIMYRLPDSVCLKWEEFKAPGTTQRELKILVSSEHLSFNWKNTQIVEYTIYLEVEEDNKEVTSENGEQLTKPIHLGGLMKFVPKEPIVLNESFSENVEFKTSTKVVRGWLIIKVKE